MNKLQLAFTTAILTLGSEMFVGVSEAQTITVPTVPNVGPKDVFSDVVGGIPSANTKFVKGGQIAAVSLYHDAGTLTTGAGDTYTFTNGVLNYFAHAAGTLSLITITTEPNPTDGKRECFWADQTVTALTWTPNTGQTIAAGVASAGVSKVTQCITYEAADGSWHGSP